MATLITLLFSWVDLHKQKSMLISILGVSIGELIQKIQTLHVPVFLMECAELFSRTIGGFVGGITILTFIISLFKNKKNESNK